MIDPLDGTKEFLEKNGEFTVNIALIANGYPVLGVISIPVTGVSYWGISACGAYRIEGNVRNKLQVKHSLFNSDDEKEGIVVLASRRHGGEKMEQLQKWLSQRFANVDYKQAGSSLKFCRIAEGLADFYPRLAPTCEWDTAAGQAILEAAGGHLVGMNFERLRYNTKASLLNPFFYAAAGNLPMWKETLAAFSSVNK